MMADIVAKRLAEQLDCQASRSYNARPDPRHPTPSCSVGLESTQCQATTNHWSNPIWSAGTWPGFKNMARFRHKNGEGGDARGYTTPKDAELLPG
jgi:hypothetical protein